MIITSRRIELESRDWSQIAAFETFFPTVIKFFDILIIFGGDIDNISKDSKKVVFGGATSMLEDFCAVLTPSMATPLPP